MTNSDPARVYLSVAANLNPEENIWMALSRLADQVNIVALSKFYRTAAIGRPEQPDYLNGVARIATALDPVALKTTVLRPLEAALGRERTADSYAARCIDLDILLFREEIVKTEELTIPDPDIVERPFLSAGLLELAPKISLPGHTRPLADSVDPVALAGLQEDTAFTQRLKEQFTP